MANRKSADRKFPTDAELEEYFKLSPLLHSAIKEVKEFSKKRPDGVMSSQKVRLLNRLLEQLKEAMKVGPATQYLDLLDEEALPDYSDAVLILSQYDAAITSFRTRFQGSDSQTGAYETRWFTEEAPPVWDEDEDEDWD
jgi:hypothetical protein